MNGDDKDSPEGPQGSRTPKSGWTGPSGPVRGPFAVNSFSGGGTTTTTILNRFKVTAATGDDILACVRSRYTGSNFEQACAFEDHYQYEVEMFTRAIEEIEAEEANPSGNRRQHVYAISRGIEQICLHGRNLARFLAGSDRTSGWAATDFTNNSYRTIPFGGLDEDLLRDMNDQVSHLSRARTVDERRKVTTEVCRKTIYPTIIRGLVAFHLALRDEFKPLCRCEFSADPARVTVKERQT
jgi:hypothetical protein